MKRIKKFLIMICVCSMVIGISPVTMRAATKKKLTKDSGSMEQQMARMYVQMVQEHPSPDFSDTWKLIAIQRSGIGAIESYQKKYYENIVSYAESKDWKMEGSSEPECANMILGLTSIGIDATQVAKHNLFLPISSMKKVEASGIKGVIGALLAVNAHDSYQFVKMKDASDQVTEEKLIQMILKDQNKNGGWSLEENGYNPDLTSQALQALAPYVEQKAEVAEAVRQGIGFLSDVQKSSGGFSLYKKENAKSCANVIIALSSLSIDANSDPRFVKDGHSVMEALQSYYLETKNGFKEILTSEHIDEKATEQGFCALVSYQRMERKQSSIYVMKEISLREGETPEVSAETTTARKTTAKKTTEKRTTARKTTATTSTQKKTTARKTTATTSTQKRTTATRSTQNRTTARTSTYHTSTSVQHRIVPIDEEEDEDVYDEEPVDEEDISDNEEEIGDEDIGDEGIPDEENNFETMDEDPEYIDGFSPEEARAIGAYEKNAVEQKMVVQHTRKQCVGMIFIATICMILCGTLHTLVTYQVFSKKWKRKKK